MSATWIILLLVVAAIVVAAASIRRGSARGSPANAQTIGIVLVLVVVVAGLVLYILRPF